MTEVRSISGRDTGLFATQAFGTGSVILHEDKPLIQLTATSDELAENLSITKQTTCDGLVDEGSSGGISAPETVHDKGKFVGMVKAAVAFSLLHANGNNAEDVLKLYAPSEAESLRLSSEEELAHSCASAAIDYITKNAVKNSKVESLMMKDKNILKRIMLIWSCNAFEGGRIYKQISRINHSCDPNAVVVENGERQEIRAATSIAPDDEITISYLGSMLYADQTTRRAVLERSKHFSCHCARCTNLAVPDQAGAVPCPVCHPRQGRSLDEDTQYDDDDSVHYAIPNADDTAFLCKGCRRTFTKSDTEYKLLFQVSDSVCAKVTAFLQDQSEQQLQPKQSAAAAAAAAEEEEDTANASLIHKELLEQHLNMAFSVLGAKHWTTNLLLHLQLDLELKELHAEMLTQSQDDSHLERIAQLIDSLQRLCHFVDGLAPSLRLHPGHLLGHVIIGVARALVSLGDVKSQKYAAEWLQKIDSDDDNYVQQFESQGIQKVVATLKMAWQRGACDEKVAKKPKVA